MWKPKMTFRRYAVKPAGASGGCSRGKGTGKGTGIETGIAR